MAGAFVVAAEGAAGLALPKDSVCLAGDGFLALSGGVAFSWEKREGVWPERSEEVWPMLGRADDAVGTTVASPGPDGLTNVGNGDGESAADDAGMGFGAFGVGLGEKLKLVAAVDGEANEKGVLLLCDGTGW